MGKNNNKNKKKETKVEEPKKAQKKVEKVKEEKKIEEVKEEIKEEVKEEQPVVEEPKKAKKEKKQKDEKPKQKHKLLIFFIVLIALALAGLGCYRAIISNPKVVFKRAINQTYKKVVKMIDTFDSKIDTKQDLVLLKGTLNIDSNNPDITNYHGANLTNLKFEGEVGVDGKNQKQVTNMTVKGKNETVSIKTQTVDNKSYIKTSFSDDIMFTNQGIDEDYVEEMGELRENNTDVKLLKKVLHSLKKIAGKALDSSSISKDEATIKIAGERYDVNKYSYKVTDKTLQKYLTEIVNKILDSKELMKDLAKLNGLEADEVKEQLKEIKSEIRHSDFDDISGKVNVYTKGFTEKIIGFDFVVERVKIFSYYTYKDDTEMSFLEMFTLTSEKEDDEYNIKLKALSETVGEATVRSFTDEKIDFDYSIKSRALMKTVLSAKFFRQLGLKGEDLYNTLDELEDTIEAIEDMPKEASGTVYFTANESKSGTSGEYKFRIKINSNYTELNGSYSIEYPDSIETFSTKGAIAYSEGDLLEDFKVVAEKDEDLNALYNYLHDDYIEKLYDNSYGFEPIDLMNITEYSKGNKIIVWTGTPDCGYYCESYSEEMKKAVKEIEYKVYYFDYYSLLNDDDVLDQEKLEIFQSIPCEPEDSVCEDAKTYLRMPTTFVIEDGKIINAFMGSIPKDSIVKEVEKTTTIEEPAPEE